MARLFLALLSVAFASVECAFEGLLISSGPGAAEKEVREELVVVRAAERGGVLPPLRLSKLGFPKGAPGAPGAAEQWVVLFCVDWWEPCQELRRTFRASASQYERTFNVERLLTPAVRFAEVDCAADKVLCNEHKVDWYPTVVYYSAGARRAAWQASGRDTIAKDRRAMVGWLHQHIRDDTEAAQEAAVTAALELPAASPAAPRSAAGRFPPIVAALLGILAWFLGNGLELIRSGREALRLAAQGAAAAAAAKMKKKKVETPRQKEEDEAPKTRLQRCLPEEWAKRRQSLEL